MQWTFRTVSLDRGSAQAVTFWEWCHRSRTGAERSAGPFPSFEACVCNARDHGFRGSDKPDDYDWRLFAGTIVATTRDDEG
jgi:hypothetical protein